MNTQLQTFDELEKDLTKNYSVSQPVDNYEIHEKEAETTNTEEPAKEMSNTNLIVVQKSKEPSVPTIQTSHAIKASCKLVFNALCHDTSRFFRGVWGMLFCAQRAG